MKDFIKILRRFVPPYKHLLFLNVFFNILSTFFTLISYAAIMPILEILFKINNKTYDFIDWSDSAIDMKEKVINNFSWYVTGLIDKQGAGFTLAFLGIILIVMTMMKTGTSYLSSFFMIPIRTGIVRDIRLYMYHKIVSLPLGFFSSEKKGDVMARMTGDVAEIENSIMASLDMMFKNPIMILVYLTSMFYLSWQLTIFVLILLPFSGYVMGSIGKRLKKKSLQAQNQWGGLMAQIEETLGGLRIIKAFSAEKKVEKRFEIGNDEFRDTSNKIARRQSLAHPMSEFLGTVTIAIVLWYGGSLILSGNSSIEASSFIYYLVIFYNIINPAKEFSKAIYSVQKGLAAMERVDKILNTENEMTEKPNAVRMNEFKDKVVFKDAWFKYTNKWVLKNVNLEIPKGQTVALVGQSGSGKSTMADMLPRFYDLQQGSIFVDGVDIKDASILDLRGLMGNVNQEAILFNDTFYNNIAFGVEETSMDKVIEAAKIANAHDFISANELGYMGNIGDRGCKLSGGQRQRLSIARAILKNPPILILDEATSALDTESEKLVQSALEHLMRNRTTLVIAHRLSTIKNADLICVMHEGEIVERGKHNELMALNGYYKKLVDMQSF